MAKPKRRNLDAKTRLSEKDLYSKCDPRTLGFETTADVPPIDGTVGQERAVRSLEFGLGVRGDGYNVVVAGLPGTGRNSTLRATVSRIAAGQPPAPDWCYLHNFSDPRRPSVISLPPGRGSSFAHDMEVLLASCRREIPRHFETEAFVAEREQLVREVQRQRARAFEEVEAEAKERGFAVEAGPMGVATVPLKSTGEPMTPQEFDQLPEGDRRVMQARGEEVQSLIGQVMLRGRRMERDAQLRLDDLDRNAVLYTITPLLNEVRQQYMDIPKAIEYLQEVENDIVSHLEMFRSEQQSQQSSPLGPSPEEFFTRYKVNQFVAQPADHGAPVVIENNPNYYTLFGRVDYRSQFGMVSTDHMMVKAGSLHRANGGYFIAQAFDLLTSPLVWETLKRVLRSRELAIQNLGEQFSAIPVSTLDPQPIPLDLKVILVGNRRVFQILQQTDEDFRKLFRAKADFAVDMDRTEDCIKLYAGFVSNRAQQEKLRPFHKNAVARIIEHGSRIVEHQQKLSTQFIEISDVLTEADYWASVQNADLVLAEHVERAIEERILRSNLVEERVQEVIKDGTIRIEVSGERIGEVNGLVVFDLGDYRFGKPTRITARVSLGRGQVMNIEREAQMSGKIHNKAFMILFGYLQARFAQEQTLSFAASLVFEQVYDEIEGDSASAAELYVLLSALAEAPLQQGIAVTGSINQLGDVQAIGGVNEKIEGFYATCKAKGLTGDQGVIIPKDNVKNLMLRREVVDAVAAGTFNVWAVANVNQGIEILTGIPAGELDAKGRYPVGTVHRRCVDRLAQLSQRLAAQAQRQRPRPVRAARRPKKDKS